MSVNQIFPFLDIDWKCLFCLFIFQAVCQHDIKIIKYLVENGASFTIKDIFGNTAITHAKKLKFDDILILFKESRQWKSEV